MSQILCEFFGVDNDCRLYKELNCFLQREKERRGINKDDVIFVKISTLSKYWWCAVSSVIKSRKEEAVVFGKYCENILGYAKKIGLKLPLFNNKEKIKTLEELEKLRDKLSLQDLKGLLSCNNFSINYTLEDIEFFASAADIPLPSIINTINAEQMIIDRLLAVKSREEISSLKETSSAVKKLFSYGKSRDTDSSLFIGEKIMPEEGIKLYDKYKDELIKKKSFGGSPHQLIAKNYPTISWNMEWMDHVLVGAPDGISNDYIYEFKKLKKEFYFRDRKGPAFVQADFYGLLWEKPNKRVQFYSEDTGKIESYNRQINKTKAEETIHKFNNVACGNVEPIFPKNFKCSICDIKKECRHDFK